MSAPPQLQGTEFVGHLFLAADGPRRDADRRWLFELWHRCCDDFGIGDELAGYNRNPPVDLAATPGPGGIFAARCSPRPGMHQAVLRRVHDVFCLAVLRSPTAAEGLGWPELDAQWSEVLGQPANGVIGSARILQARLTDPAGTPAPDAALAANVRAAFAAPAAPEGWCHGGLLWGTSPFTVWEVSDRPEEPASWEGRADRRIAVVAPADQDAELSAWTWSRGDPELTPFARYLLHAAKVRYELRVWEAGQDFRRLRQETDTAVAGLLRMVDDASQAGQTPDRAKLLSASVRLAGLQAGEMGLVVAATQLREMQRTVEIAATNLAAYAGGDTDGLFADDKTLATWLDRQLDHDATYLEAARDRARNVATLTDQLVQRGQQRRQERFNLGLTGVVGAILMVFAAIQSLGYRVPLPDPVQPAVISALGAFALLVSLIVLRVAVPERRWTWLAVCAAAALLGATAAWIVMASLAVSPSAGWAWIGVGAVTGVGVATAIATAGRLRR